MGKTTTLSSDYARNISLAGIFAAMITIMTAYLFHIPLGVNGGYIHFGDSIIYLAAAILPGPYAMLAAGIGGSLADILSGASIWAPATFLIKMIITLPFTAKSEKVVCTRNIIATILAFLITGIGYYFAEAMLFGTEVAFFASVSGSAVQSAGSAIFFILFGLALDRIDFKHRFNAKDL